MAYSGIERERRFPWKVEYWWAHSAYGSLVGWTWTRRGARRKLAQSVPQFIAESEGLLPNRRTS